MLVLITKLLLLLIKANANLLACLKALLRNKKN